MSSCLNVSPSIAGLYHQASSQRPAIAIGFICSLIHKVHAAPVLPADITAKNTSQYIFASLFGTAAGVSACAYIGQSAPLALLCFSALAWTSMYSAYRTVKAIPLPTLNSTRLQLLAAR